jgi:hypothetical protein
MYYPLNGIRTGRRRFLFAGHYALTQTKNPSEKTGQKKITAN